MTRIEHFFFFGCPFPLQLLQPANGTRTSIILSRLLIIKRKKDRYNGKKQIMHDFAATWAEFGSTFECDCCDRVNHHIATDGGLKQDRLDESQPGSNYHVLKCL